MKRHGLTVDESSKQMYAYNIAALTPAVELPLQVSEFQQTSLISRPMHLTILISKSSHVTLLIGR